MKDGDNNDPDNNVRVVVVIGFVVVKIAQQIGVVPIMMMK
jgi:hypothetical protein